MASACEASCSFAMPRKGAKPQASCGARRCDSAGEIRLTADAIRANCQMDGESRASGEASGAAQSSGGAREGGGRAKRGREASAALVCTGCSQECAEDASNWRQAEGVGRGRKAKPEGPLCLMCIDFCVESCISEADLQVMVKNKKTCGELGEDLEEFAKNKRDPSIRQLIPGEGVFEEERNGSRLTCKYDFISRADFKAQHEMFPDECKLMQCRAKGKDGEVTGIVVERADSCQTLEVWTDTVVVRRRSLLSAHSNKYDRQAARVFEQQVSSRRPVLGQRYGGKYKPHTKPLVVYTPAQVRQSVQDLAAKRAGVSSNSGVRSMIGLNRVAAGRGGPQPQSSKGDDDQGSHEDDEGEETEEEEVIVEEGELDEDVADAETPVKDLSKSKRARSRTRSPATDCPSTPATSVAAKMSPTQQAFDACSIASGATSHDSRTKTPNYWLHVVTTDHVMQGIKLNRQLGFANACWKRHSTSHPVEACLAALLSLEANLVRPCFLFWGIAKPFGCMTSHLFVSSSLLPGAMGNISYSSNAF